MDSPRAAVVAKQRGNGTTVRLGRQTQFGNLISIKVRLFGQTFLLLSDQYKVITVLYTSAMYSSRYKR